MNFETVLFGGAFISPMLDDETKNFINLFSKTRHCLRTDKYIVEDNTNSVGSLILKERVYFRSGSWKNKSHYFLGKKKEEVFSNFTDEEKVMIEENILNKAIPLNNGLEVKKLKI